MSNLSDGIYPAINPYIVPTAPERIEDLEELIDKYEQRIAALEANDAYGTWEYQMALLSLNTLYRALRGYYYSN